NGITPHQSAVEALVEYRRQCGSVVHITNAPSPGAPILKQLDAIGVPREAYDALVSSGDATRGLLENWRGRTVARVGPDVDDVLFEGLDLTFGSDTEASAVVVTDLDSDDDIPADYQPRMALWRERN